MGFDFYRLQIATLYFCIFTNSLFENYGTLFSILTGLFGEYNYNKYIPKFDGMVGAILSISFSLFGYVYVLTRASFYNQSNNLIEVSKNLGYSPIQSFLK